MILKWVPGFTWIRVELVWKHWMTGIWWSVRGIVKERAFGPVRLLTMRDDCVDRAYKMGIFTRQPLSESTISDRDKAREIMDGPLVKPLLLSRIATALAEERAEALSPILALADDLEKLAVDELDKWLDRPENVAKSVARGSFEATQKAVDRIRKAAGVGL